MTTDKLPFDGGETPDIGNVASYPRRETITMRVTKRLKAQVRGVRYGELAVVSQDWRWFIIHVRTGYTVAWMWTDYKRAHRLARLLEHRFNWKRKLKDFKRPTDLPDYGRLLAIKRLLKREEKAAREKFDAQMYSEYFDGIYDTEATA